MDMMRIASGPRHEGGSRAPLRGLDAHVTGVRGFTLMELIVTLVIAGVFASLAIPDFSRFLIRNRIVSTANALVADLNYARSEAIRRQVNVTMCASTNATTCTVSPWASGWIVFATNATTDILRAHEPDSSDVIGVTGTLPVQGALPAPTAANSAISYFPDGTSNWAGVNSVLGVYNAQAAYFVCDGHPVPGDVNGIEVTIDNSGLVAAGAQNQRCPTP